MIDLAKFDWGWMENLIYIPDGSGSHSVYINPDGTQIPIGEYHKQGMIKEIFIDRCYEKYFEVENGDIVVDIGASVGPFTYSILNKKPKHVFCLEPSESEFSVLVKNTLGYPVTQINKGISDKNTIVDSELIFGGEKNMESITFEKFIKLYNLKKIDFMKIDCEGGEYHVFTDENFDYIKQNVKKISGEWHLKTAEEKINFRNFRDNILNRFPHFQVNSIDGIDIKWDLWNEHFIEYYNQIHLFIDNR